MHSGTCFRAHDAPKVIHDAMTPRVGGLADTSLSSNELLVQADILNLRGGESIGVHTLSFGPHGGPYGVSQAGVENYAKARPHLVGVAQWP